MQHWISNIHSMPLDLTRNTTYVVAENTTILTQSKNSFPSINLIQSVRFSFTEKVITILHPMKIWYSLAISLSPNNVINKAVILFAYKLICFALLVVMMKLEIVNRN